MKNFLVDLNHLDLLSVSGKDSGKLLQGQLTCNIDKLTEPGACPGAACDLKGRVISSFTLWRIEDSYYLEMQAGMAVHLAETLKKYMVFYKCQSAEAGTEFRRYGISGAEGRDLLAAHFGSLPLNQYEVLRQGDEYLLLLNQQQNRYQYWYRSGMESGMESRLLSQLQEQLPEGSHTDWQTLDIAAGIFHVDTGSMGIYTPQQLNFDLAGHVDFKKGCYTGQEIVARMHYRGKAKKRMFMLEITGESSVLVGDKVCLEGGSQLADIILVSSAAGYPAETRLALAVGELPGTGSSLFIAGKADLHVESRPFAYKT